MQKSIQLQSGAVFAAGGGVGGRQSPMTQPLMSPYTRSQSACTGLGLLQSRYVSAASQPAYFLSAYRAIVRLINLLYLDLSLLESKIVVAI